MMPFTVDKAKEGKDIDTEWVWKMAEATLSVTDALERK